MELKIRNQPMTLKDLWQDKDERARPLSEIVVFFLRFHKPHVYRYWFNTSDAHKLGLFRWENYLIARSWLEGHKALAATLRLRGAFRPWEVKKS